MNTGTLDTILDGQPVFYIYNEASIPAGLDPLTLNNVIDGQPLFFIFQASVSGSNYTLALNDTLTLSETLTSIKTALRTFADSLANIVVLSRTTSTIKVDTLTSNSQVLRAFEKTYNDSISFLEDFVYDQYTIISHNILDTLTASEQLQKSITTNLTDNISTFEDLDRHLSILKSDLINNIESLNSAVFSGLDLNDTLTLNDSLFRNITKACADIVTATESLFKNISVDFADALNQSESLFTNTFESSDVTDLITLTDNIERFIHPLKLDSLLTPDTLSKTFNEVLTSTVTILDSYSYLLTKFTSYIDSIGVSDQISRYIEKAISEITSISEILQIYSQRTRAYTDSLSLLHFTSRLREPVKNLFDTFSITSTIAKFRGIFLTDTTIVLDNLTKFFNGLPVINQFKYVFKDVKKKIANVFSKNKSQTDNTHFKDIKE